MSLFAARARRIYRTEEMPHLKTQIHGVYVDFFVEAGLSAGDGRGVGPGKDRRFIQIPTAAEASGRFTYAVPPEHVPSTADEALARDSEVILAAYLERRHRMRDAGSAVEELLRLNAIFEPRTIRRGPIEPDDASPSAP